MTSGFRRATIVPQTPAPPPMGLLDMAILPGPDEQDLNGRPMRVPGANGQGAGYRWEAGFAWKPRQCGQVTGRNECSPSAAFTYRANDEAGIREHQPVIIDAANPCTSGLANDWDFERQSAIDALIAGEPVAAEAELWDGPLARAAHAAGDAAYDQNLWLTKHGVATVLNGSGVSPQRALGILEQFLANTGYGSWGTIHCQPQILAHFNYDLHPSGRQLFSARNTLIVPGSGYSGFGPAATDQSRSRSVADGVTNSTTTITSATAAFASSDVGAQITGAGIPAGTTIASVTNSTTAILSQAATATASGVTVTIVGGTPAVAPAGETWMYATGRITYRQGDIQVTPDNESQALDRSTNTVKVTAQRSSAGTWDSCAVGAVLVTLPA